MLLQCLPYFWEKDALKLPPYAQTSNKAMQKIAVFYVTELDHNTQDVEYVFLIGFNIHDRRKLDVSLPRSHRKAENAFVLLFTVPFTASPTNAIEMNNAMTSSVDL